MLTDSQRKTSVCVRAQGVACLMAQSESVLCEMCYTSGLESKSKSVPKSDSINVNEPLNRVLRGVSFESSWQM